MQLVNSFKNCKYLILCIALKCKLFYSVMALCKMCGIEKLTNEFPSVTVSKECDHPPLACLRVSCTISRGKNSVLSCTSTNKRIVFVLD